MVISLHLILWGSLTESFKIISDAHAYVSDLGILGKTYEITEEDLIQVLQKKLLEKKDSGELEREMMIFKERSKEFVKRPGRINLPRAKFYRRAELNILYKLPEDIKDADGKILFRAGTVVNPLKIKMLTKSLCFIDGDDKEQVEWLIKNCMGNSSNKLILVNGDFLEISNKYNRRFYYDQEGYLINKLGIQNLPAIVEQKGELLYVEEIPIK